VSDLSGGSTRPDVVAQLGELAGRVSLVEGLILGAEAKAAPDKFGVMRPNDALLYASQVLQQAMYPEVIAQIRGMAGGSVIQLPSSSAELLNPETAADMNRYVHWPNGTSEERVKVLKLLWDAIGSEFGARHLQYEMFYAGEPGAIRGRSFRAFDWPAAEALVDHCLTGYDLQTPLVPPPFDGM
jgi:4-hydroxyphenylacetate 3-monooxygenase